MIQARNEILEIKMREVSILTILNRLASKIEKDKPDQT